MALVDLSIDVNDVIPQRLVVQRLVGLVQWQPHQLHRYGAFTRQDRHTIFKMVDQGRTILHVEPDASPILLCFRAFIRLNFKNETCCVLVRSKCFRKVLQKRAAYTAASELRVDCKVFKKVNVLVEEWAYYGKAYDITLDISEKK